MQEKIKKNFKKVIFVIIFVLVLSGLLLQYGQSVVETYYKITGRIIEDTIKQQIIFSGHLSDNSNPENSGEIKGYCITGAPHPNCTFIRAKITNWPQYLRGESYYGIDITCTYGCPK